MSDRNETIELLKECDAGTRMGITSLKQVIADLNEGKLRTLLEESKTRHEQIQSRIMDYLKEYGADGKDPAMMATIMASMKESMKMMVMQEKESAAANLIIDGCSMGIKSIYKYFNQYPNAEQEIKQLVDEIVEEEENLSRQLRCYL